MAHGGVGVMLVYKSREGGKFQIMYTEKIDQDLQLTDM